MAFFFIGQEDVDFESITNQAYNPVPIANDGVRARTGSSPNIVGVYNVQDCHPININLNNYAGITANYNDLHLSCYVYPEDTSASGDPTNGYMFRFDNTNSDFSTTSVFITSTTVFISNYSGTPTLFTSLGNLSTPIPAATLSKIDFHYLYDTSGAITLNLNGSQVFSYSGDTTHISSTGYGFSNILLSSAGAHNSNAGTFYSEIIVGDQDNSSYFMGYADCGLDGATPLCDYNTPVGGYSTMTYGTTWNIPFTSFTAPQSTSGLVIYAGRTSVGANNESGDFGSYWNTWFSVNNITSGMDAVFTYSSYSLGNPYTFLQNCLPRAENTITGINLQITNSNGYPVTQDGESIILCKMLSHFVYGTGTANPCPQAVPSTNVMIVS